VATWQYLHTVGGIFRCTPQAVSWVWSRWWGNELIGGCVVFLSTLRCVRSNVLARYVGEADPFWNSKRLCPMQSCGDGTTAGGMSGLFWFGNVLWLVKGVNPPPASPSTHLKTDPWIDDSQGGTCQCHYYRLSLPHCHSGVSYEANFCSVKWVVMDARPRRKWCSNEANGYTQSQCYSRPPLHQCLSSIA
jgi:hypothetical protein